MTEVVIGAKYKHYRGSLYELLFLGSENIYVYQPYSVILKEVATGLIYSLPVSSFTGRVFSNSKIEHRFTMVVDNENN